LGDAVAGDLITLKHYQLLFVLPNEGPKICGSL